MFRVAGTPGPLRRHRGRFRLTGLVLAGMLLPVLVFACGGSSDSDNRPPAGASTTASPRAGASPVAQAATSTVVPPTATPAIHTVTSGESLGAICAARLPGLSVNACVEAIVEINNLSGANEIGVGQTLSLPTPVPTATPPEGSAQANVPTPANAATAAAFTATAAVITPAAQVTSPPTAAAANPTSTQSAAQPTASASTATLVPTSPAAATSTPGSASSSTAYIETVDKAVDAYIEHIDAIESLFSAPDLASQTWYDQVYAQTEGMVATGQTIRGASPPSCLQGTHAQLLQAVNLFDQAAANFEKAIEEVSDAALQTATNQTNEAIGILTSASAALAVASC
jgi:hypothetical protein